MRSPISKRSNMSIRTGGIANLRYLRQNATKKKGNGARASRRKRKRPGKRNAQSVALRNAARGTRPTPISIPRPSSNNASNRHRPRIFRVLTPAMR